MQSISNLSNVTTLDLTINSPTDSVFPSVSLVHDLLVILHKVSRLYLCYNNLLEFLKSSSMVEILQKQIETLRIIFNTDPPLLENMIQIFNIFAAKLKFLYFQLHIDFPTYNFYLILPLLMCGICPELLIFELELQTPEGQQQQPTFNEDFKLWLKECLTALSKANAKRSTSIEYKITDRQFAISF
ncbi:unnamed protein product [Rotaria sp. Silwood2]|nr:unnamed protein product [Rotaria sp. Silwood2]CAF2702469.1 unnamed protein product [Rotaria sp. Silwood2]CAF2983396.1 unnamed protein product [Rotaria sp. Silwood2]CAF3134240.1 unnamed protein product [Rotaria sp. Silwood2]CAF4325923.1 unnamed protein product [Rotaria sp. Silwood2]